MHATDLQVCILIVKTVNSTPRGKSRPSQYIIRLHIITPCDTDHAILGFSPETHHLYSNNNILCIL